MKATGGLRVGPGVTIERCPALEVLVVPGGWGTRRESFPAVTVEEKLHVVEDGHVLTSAGISAGMDMALRWWRAIAARPSRARRRGAWSIATCPRTTARRI